MEPKTNEESSPGPRMNLGPGESKRILGSLLLAVFTVMLGVGIIAPLLPGYARSLGANGIVLGLIFSIFSLFRTFFTPVTGILSDRWGRKHFMSAGMLAYFILSLAYVQAQSTPVLLVVRALHGLAAAFIVPVANAYVGDLAPPDKEGTYMGLFLASFLAGFALGPALGGILHDRLGMASCFLTLGILALLALVLIVAFVPNLRTDRDEGGRPRREGSSFEALKSRVIITLLIFTFVGSIGRGSIVSFVPLLAQEKLGMSATLLGAILTTNLSLAAVLLLPFGILADRTDRKRILLAGTLLSGLIFALLPSASGLWDLLTVNILLGIGTALAFPAAQAIAVTLARGRGMGTVLASLQAATGAGFATGPLLSGMIYKTYGIDLVFRACSGFLIIASIYGLFFLHPPLRQIR
jgi:DHA1 family multidrug resistance protein-like MFS transporter